MCFQGSYCCCCTREMRSASSQNAGLHHSPLFSTSSCSSCCASGSCSANTEYVSTISDPLFQKNRCTAAKSTRAGIKLSLQYISTSRSSAKWSLHIRGLCTLAECVLAAFPFDRLQVQASALLRGGQVYHYHGVSGQKGISWHLVNRYPAS